MNKTNPIGVSVRRKNRHEVKIEVIESWQLWDDITGALETDSTAELDASGDTGIIRLSRSEAARLMLATQIPAAIIAAGYLEAPWLVAEEFYIKIDRDESGLFFLATSDEPYLTFKFKTGIYDDPRVHPYHQLWLWETRWSPPQQLGQVV
jgi:hypothetical protein